MIEINSKKNGHGYDVFQIKTDEGVFAISFENNQDLYWTYIYNGSILNTPDMHEFIITKENYFIYNLFDKLYSNIKNKVISYDQINYFKVRDNNELFKDGVIDWHSDDNIYELSSRLLIEKLDEEYKVKFIKSKSDDLFKTYTVRISNSGSRYNPFNIEFMNMYNKLKQYDPNCHQIHMEEYLYKKKIKRR